MPKPLNWIASVGCEGGPVIIAPAATYMNWPGAAPLPIQQRTKLHVWGQFTSELPEKFRPAGPEGHQFIEASGDALVALKDELVLWLRSKWPGVQMQEEFSEIQVTRPDDKQMWFELAPASEYDRSWQESGQNKEAWYHSWGQVKKTLFWEVEGGGIVEIGRSEDRSELVLLRTWVDEEADEQKAKAMVEQGKEPEQADLEPMELGDVLVVAWSPPGAQDVEQASSLEALEQLGRQDAVSELETVGIADMGAVFGVASGRYVVSYGELEADDWSARWCRLRRKG